MSNFDELEFLVFAQHERDDIEHFVAAFKNHEDAAGFIGHSFADSDWMYRIEQRKD